MLHKLVFVATKIILVAAPANDRQEALLLSTGKSESVKFYCIVLYCMVLYCVVLHCIVLYQILPLSHRRRAEERVRAKAGHPSVITASPSMPRTASVSRTQPSSAAGAAPRSPVSITSPPTTFCMRRSRLCRHFRCGLDSGVQTMVGVFTVGYPASTTSLPPPIP